MLSQGIHSALSVLPNQYATAAAPESYIPIVTVAIKVHDIEPVESRYKLRILWPKRAILQK